MEGMQKATFHCGESFSEDVFVVGFTYLYLPACQVRVTVVDCCVPCHTCAVCGALLIPFVDLHKLKAKKMGRRTGDSPGEGKDARKLFSSFSQRYSLCFFIYIYF